MCCSIIGGNETHPRSLDLEHPSVLLLDESRSRQPLSLGHPLIPHGRPKGVAPPSLSDHVDGVFFELLDSLHLLDLGLARHAGDERAGDLALHGTQHVQGGAAAHEATDHFFDQNARPRSLYPPSSPYTVHNRLEDGRSVVVLPPVLFALLLLLAGIHGDQVLQEPALLSVVPRESNLCRGALSLFHHATGPVPELPVGPLFEAEAVDEVRPRSIPGQALNPHRRREEAFLQMGFENPLDFSSVRLAPVFFDHPLELLLLLVSLSKHTEQDEPRELPLKLVPEELQSDGSVVEFVFVRPDLGNGERSEPRRGEGS